jgi:hypothetical protein
MPRASSTIPDSHINTDKANDIPKTTDELRQEALDGVLQLAQFGCLAFGDFADAGAIGVFGPPMATEVVNLAKENSKVAEKVDLLIQVGPYAGLVAAAIPFLAQLLVNHKVFKAEQFGNAGVMEPEHLEMRMKTQVLHRAAEARRQQMEAQEQLQRLEEEMLRNQNGDAEKASESAND